MAYQHKEGSGTLFPNTYKKSDNQPDWRGDALVNGVLVEISGWNKGERISIAIKKKEARQGGQRQEQPQRGVSSRDLPPNSSPAPGTTANPDEDTPFALPPRSVNPMRLA